MLGHVRPRSRQRLSFSVLVGGAAVFASCTFPDFRAGSGACAGNACAGASSGVGGALGGSSNLLPAGSGGVGGVTLVASDGGAPGGEASFGGEAGFGGEGLSGAPGVASAPGELEGVYEIVVEHSSKCLDPNGKATLARHVTLQQLSCDGTETQTFILKSSADGSYTIAINASNDCVDIEGSAPDNATAIVRSPCDGRASQNWQLLRQDDSTYLIVNALSSKCLDVEAGALDNGKSLQEWACNARTNQKWFLSSRATKPLPLVVDNFFSVDTWTSNGAAAFSLTPSNSSDSSDCNGNRALDAQGICRVFSLSSFPSSDDHLGMSWVHPHVKWGSAPGILVDPGAARVHFQARGEKGGEGVTFQAGGVSGHAFNDGFQTDPLYVILSSSWQSYSLDMSSQSYQNGVITGFAVSARLATNQAPLKFYVDDVVWE